MTNSAVLCSKSRRHEKSHYDLKTKLNHAKRCYGLSTLRLRRAASTKFYVYDLS